MIKFTTTLGPVLINPIRVAYIRVYRGNNTAICFSEQQGDFIVVNHPWEEVAEALQKFLLDKPPLPVV